MIELSVRVTAEGSRRRVHLSGECDIASAPALQEVLSEMRGPEVTEIVIEAEEMEFLDSYGLGVIVGALKRLRDSGGSLRIANAPVQVRRVLEVAGLDRVIPLD